MVAAFLTRALEVPVRLPVPWRKPAVSLAEQAQRDPAAFAELVREHQGVVRGFLRRVVGDDALADDLAQDTFMKAHKSLHTYRGDGSLRSWLLRIAYRSFVSSKRKRSETPTEIDEAAFTAPTPERLMANDVQKALRLLSEHERFAIAACFFDDMTHEEAAAVFNIPVGTLKSHIARAKEKLRAPLAAYAPPEVIRE